MALILTVISIFAVLVLSELWWRNHPVHEEFARKFVHITVGSFVAFWPYFLTHTEILLLSVAFLISVSISRALNIFSAIHSVQRPTWGEFWFALVVGLLALMPDHHHIYTVALLEMSLADGLAAVIGIRFGRKTLYKLFGAQKSIVGTITFFLVSTVILVIYSHVAPGASIAAWIIPISLAATIIENIAPKGLDNLLVPLLVASSLLALL
jgi:phytol kinase